MAIERKVKHWQDPVNLILGLWMLISPWVLGYQGETTAMWNAVVLGILIGAVAIGALAQPKAWEEWANVVLGIWLVISPWVLGFSTMREPMANAAIVGVVTAVLALWTLGTDKDLGGWWSPVT